MKILLIAGSFLLLAASCKQNTKDAQVMGAYKDSSELAAFNQWKLQKSIDSAKALDSMRAYQAEKANLAAEREAAASTPKARTRTVYVRDGYRSSAVSSPQPAANNRQGWSKAAKGAVIGGAGGALIGGTVTNRNKGTGAVVGAVVGGATGYAIGRGEDRKDGRVKPRQ